MKLTYGQLITSADAFGRFASEKFPLKTSIALKDILRRFNVLIADYNEERVKRCEEFGTLNAVTNHYEFDAAAQPKWTAAMDELHGGIVEIAGERIALNGLLSSITISPGDLLALEWLIDDGVEKD